MLLCLMTRSQVLLYDPRKGLDAMNSDLLFLLQLCAAVGCGLVAGVFFAFSTFVMAALAQQPLAQGIATMQTINVTVINPWFMSVFLGTAGACVLLGSTAILHRQQPGMVLVLVASLLYLVGSVVVTIFGNVPLNDALANLTPEHPEASSFWAKYLNQWTLWNHLRTIAALAAATLFTIAIGK